MLFLRRMGLSTEIPDLAPSREQLLALNPERTLITTIEDIKRRDQFLVKEHFEEYRAKYAGQFIKKIATTAFFDIVGTTDRRGKYGSGRDSDPALLEERGL